VAATPPDHPNRAIYLSDLSIALGDRFERTGQLTDLDRAIEVGEEAVAATPPNHPNRAIYLSDLSIALGDRFERTGQLTDLDRAIEVGEEAVAATPPDHPNRAGQLFNFGIALETRFDRNGRQADLGRARACYREAAGVASASPLMRALSAARWGFAVSAAGDPNEAVSAFSAAIELAGEVVSRGLARADQEYLLAQLAGLAPVATAACVQAGLPNRAVELFEQGRGVLFGQALDARTDVTDLADVHPELAERFTELVEVLDRSDSVNTATLSVVDGAETLARTAGVDRRRLAAAELDQLLAEIRAQPGFDTFLLPRPVTELQRVAEVGPIVLVNVAQTRSDALVLHPTDVGVVPLQGLDLDGAMEQVDAFLAALQNAQQPSSESTHRRAEAALADVLSWMWDTITGPVLDYLGYTSAPGQDDVWPRVFWCQSGPLSFLPLHAAGHHQTRFDPQPATVIDRVVSSTIPTVRALLEARQQPILPTGQTVGPNDSEHRVLVVAMRHTPDQADLPGASAEAELIEGMLPGRVDVLGVPGTPQATHDTVMAMLPQYAWVHFSCHGTSDLDDPSSSHLLLADYQSRPLTVLDLTRARLEGVDLAFLSACTTARSGAVLPDEPIHLAAACKLAGYRHVIATLWPIDDLDAVRVTRTVYKTLISMEVGWRADTAATALHHATRNLRHLYLNQPSRWAAHTHMGP
jgi:tetratricopeptide (TPR) repeat protein